MTKKYLIITQFVSWEVYSLEILTSTKLDSKKNVFVLFSLHYYKKYLFYSRIFEKKKNLTGATDSPSTGCSATKFELQTIFERALKLSENFA